MFYVDTAKYDLALQTVLPLQLGHEEMDVLINADLPEQENFARVLPSNRRNVIEYARNQTPNAGTKF